MLILLSLTVSVAFFPVTTFGQTDDMGTVPTQSEPGFPDEPTLEPNEVPVEPTLEPTEVPVEPTLVPVEATTEPTLSPTATPTPTQTPTPRSRISVQSIVAGSGCTQTSSTDVVAVMVAVVFTCNTVNGPGNSPVTRTFSGLTAGWEYQVNNEPWRSVAGPVFEQQDTIPSYVVRLRATSAVAEGSSGRISVSVATSNGTGGIYTATLSATLAVPPRPTASDLQLFCAPAALNIGAGQSQTITCTYSGRSSLTTRQITLSQLLVPVPAGWTITSTVGTVTSSTLTIAPNATITYSTTSPRSYTFSFTLTPSCTAATTVQSTSLTSTFSFNATTGLAGASFTQQFSRSNASSVVASVEQNALTWNQPFSFTDTTVSGGLVIRVVASGCSGWNIQLSVSPFIYSGPNQGSTISNANLTLSSASNPVVVSGSGTGVSAQTRSAQMNATVKVLNALAGAGIGTCEQQLTFSLTIPGQSRVGTYQSTVTVTAASGP
ncbi:MAG: hypothetical protein ACR2OU_14770 [Thermomicrobiales bacterium]